MGYKTTKIVDETPDTIPSHVTRISDRDVAINRFKVAVNEDDNVANECDARLNRAVKMSDNGTIPVRAKVYIGNCVYLTSRQERNG